MKKIDCLLCVFPSSFDCTFTVWSELFFSNILRVSHHFLLFTTLVYFVAEVNAHVVLISSRYY